jgi:hypothetical protein
MFEAASVVKLISIVFLSFVGAEALIWVIRFLRWAVAKIQKYWKN